MIIVSRLNGERFGVNAEHVERVEETPDTVLTLVDGKKYLVRESLDDIIGLIVAYRARILRVSYEPAGDGLRVVESRLETADDPVNSGNTGNGDH